MAAGRRRRRTIRGILRRMPTIAAPAEPPLHTTLLASDRVRVADRIDLIPITDRARRGSVATRPRRGIVRRAEPGPHGPLVYEATQAGDQVMVSVWGPEATAPEDRAAALHAARGWIGMHDRPPDLADVTVGHPALHHAARRVGTVRLSRLPRVQEAVGRAILGQLVQGIEARRSTAQLAALRGIPAGCDLWSWPTATALGRTPAHAMRRCGISLKGATAIHHCAVDDPQLERVRDDRGLLDRRLRAVPGIGPWTSAETRFALGDPDAVSVGDLNLPTTVCHALGGASGDACTDELMLELLEPYRGQRGRVIRLVVLAVRRGLLPRARRRAPRAALSAHRYW
jgi:3-methyladenine DNA glycosylase/8-oxoguanine DNA glycosylase